MDGSNSSIQVNNDIQRATKCKGHRKLNWKKAKKLWGTKDEGLKVPVTERCSRKLSAEGRRIPILTVQDVTLPSVRGWAMTPRLGARTRWPCLVLLPRAEFCLTAECWATGKKKSKPRAISLLSEKLDIRLWLHHKALVGRTWSFEPQTPSIQVTGFWIFRTGLWTTLEIYVALLSKQSRRTQPFAWY